MDYSLIIGIIGTVLTIVFGFLSIKISKAVKYPGSMNLLIDYEVDLYDASSHQVEELVITYKQQPINKRLIFFKAILVNSGRMDITDDLVEEPLNFQLTDHGKWLDAKLIDAHSPNASIQNIQKVLTLNLGLFKAKERIRFEGVVELKSEDKKFSETIKGQHRIAETMPVVNVKSSNQLDLKSELKEIKTKIWLLVSALAFVAIISLLDHYNDIILLENQIVDNSGKVTTVNRWSDDSFSIYTENGERIDTMTLEELELMFPDVKFNQDSSPSHMTIALRGMSKDPFVILFGSLLSLGLLVNILDFLKKRRFKALYYQD